MQLTINLLQLTNNAFDSSTNMMINMSSIFREIIPLIIIQISCTFYIQVFKNLNEPYSFSQNLNENFNEKKVQTC